MSDDVGPLSTEELDALRMSWRLWVSPDATARQREVGRNDVGRNLGRLLATLDAERARREAAEAALRSAQLCSGPTTAGAR